MLHVQAVMSPDSLPAQGLGLFAGQIARSGR